MLGIHTERKGLRFDFMENVVEICINRMKLNAINKPNAMFIPIPPFLLFKEIANAIIVKITVENG